MLVLFVTSYLCKAERTMSDLLYQSKKNCLYWEMFFSLIEKCLLMKQFIDYYPYHSEKVQLMFFEKRVYMLKCAADLTELPSDSTDIFQINILDCYAARPQELRNICLADFASNFALLSNEKSECDLDDDEQQDISK